MKKIICIVYLITLLYFCTSCTVQTTIPRPEENNLEFWITDDVTDFDWVGHDEIYGGFGFREFLDKRYKAVITGENEYDRGYPEYYVSYHVSSYPDYSSKTKAITTINIADPTITIYGISFNSSLEEIEKAMKENGLRRNTKDERCCFTKGNINIVFFDKQIIIDAESTNRFGIIY